MRGVALLLISGLLMGCSVYSASSWNRQQWEAHRAFWSCARCTPEYCPGQAYVSSDPAPDGTLYYTPFVRPEAQARFEACLRTDHPTLKAVAGPRPR